MAGEGDENFLESVLTECNQRCQNTVLSDFDTKDLTSGSDLNRDDSTKSITGKRKAPIKPKRKASCSPQIANCFLADFDIGEPVDLDIQEIMDTVKANNQTVAIAESTNNDISVADSPEHTSTVNKTSEVEEGTELNSAAATHVYANQETSDQHIYSDADHSFTLDLIPPIKSGHHRTNSASLERANCSLEDISTVGADGDSYNLDASRLKTSASVQSNLNLVGLESSGTSKRLGRFGSRRSRDKNSDKDFGHLLDAAASKSSHAYAKFRQLKKKAKRDILSNIPGKGGPTKAHRDLDDESRRKSHSKSDLSPFAASTSNDNGVGRSDDDKPIKSGWLKKQGGVRKNWSDRWFVLTTKSLHFYKDRDEAKLCGAIPITGCAVDENPQINDGSYNRYLFEIIPEFGKRNQSSQTFAAATKNDKDSWVKAVKKVQGGPTAAGVFGQSLSHTVRLEESIAADHGKLGHEKVPYVVVKCCEFIRENKGFSEEGLFRLPGHADEVRELRDAFDRGEIPTFDSRTDIHTIASLMKSYLRELPEPVVPFHMYSVLIEAAKAMVASKQNSKSTSDVLNEQVVDEIKPHLDQLPEENFHLLGYLSHFLDEVQCHSTKNKMDIDNLALMFGPNILRSENLDPVSMISHSTYVQYVMSQFIRNHKHYFGEMKAEPSQDFTPSIPDVAADADRQDISNRISENNLINSMKSGLPIIGSNLISNGGNTVVKRTSLHKPIRLPEHGNRPILPPKPSVRQDSSDRFDGISRSSSVFSYSSNVPNGGRPLSNGSSSESQGLFPSSQKFPGGISNRNSVEDMIMTDNASSAASSPRDSASEYVHDKHPRPPARRRKPTRESPLRPASATSHIPTSDVFDGDISLGQTVHSFPNSRTSSVSNSADAAQRERTRSATSTPKRPNVRPPPPPPPLHTHASADDPSYEELKETVRLLKEKLCQQRGEFLTKLHHFEQAFVSQMRDLKSHPILSVGDVKIDLYAEKTSSNRSSEDVSSERDETVFLRESVKEEQQLRRVAEIQLKNERWGRQAAEERNVELLQEIERLRSPESV